MAAPGPKLNPPFDVTLRTFMWPSPELGFEPLKSPGRLSLFGLPQLPDQFETPHAYKFWHKLYAPPLDWIQSEQFMLTAEQGLRSATERRTATSTLYET